MSIARDLFCGRLASQRAGMTNIRQHRTMSTVRHDFFQKTFPISFIHNDLPRQPCPEGPQASLPRSVQPTFRGGPTEVLREPAGEAVLRHAEAFLEWAAKGAQKTRSRSMPIAASIPPLPFPSSSQAQGSNHGKKAARHDGNDHCHSLQPGRPRLADARPRAPIPDLARDGAAMPHHQNQPTGFHPKAAMSSSPAIHTVSRGNDTRDTNGIGASSASSSWKPAHRSSGRP